MNNQLNTSKRRWLEKKLIARYGFKPRMTEYKGKIYLSDPVRPSEPWKVYENEFDMEKDLNIY